MADSRGESDTILREAGRSLTAQQDSGYHRRSISIGRGSADLKRRNRALRGKLVAGSIAAILIAATGAGLALNGIGFAGIMITVLAILVALLVFAKFPTVKVPRRSDLNKGDPRQLVARTELWLEQQRPALPPPAVKIVDDIGVQLDALGVQLAHVEASHPAARETRKLVGEHLPEMIDAYRKIPAELRQEQRAGGIPDDQLTKSLGRISEEIDRVTRQIADGALDDLAIRTRYLEYRYGEEDMTSPENRS